MADTAEEGLAGMGARATADAGGPGVFFWSALFSFFAFIEDHRRCWMAELQRSSGQLAVSGQLLVVKRHRWVGDWYYLMVVSGATVNPWRDR